MTKSHNVVKQDKSLIFHKHYLVKSETIIM